MSGGRFQLADHPWLALLVLLLAIPIGQVLAGALVIGLLRPRRSMGLSFSLGSFRRR